MAKWNRLLVFIILTAILVGERIVDLGLMAPLIVSQYFVTTWLAERNRQWLKGNDE